MATPHEKSDTKARCVTTARDFGHKACVQSRSGYRTSDRRCSRRRPIVNRPPWRAANRPPTTRPSSTRSATTGEAGPDLDGCRRKWLRRQAAAGGDPPGRQVRRDGFCDRLRVHDGSHRGPAHQTPRRPGRHQWATGEVQPDGGQDRHVPRAKLGEHVGRLGDDDMVRLGRAVLVFFGLAGYGPRPRHSFPKLAQSSGLFTIAGCSSGEGQESWQSAQRPRRAKCRGRMAKPYSAWSRSPRLANSESGTSMTAPQTSHIRCWWASSARW